MRSTTARPERSDGERTKKAHASQTPFVSARVHGLLMSGSAGEAERSADAEASCMAVAYPRDQPVASPGASSNNVLLIHTRASPPVDQSSSPPGCYLLSQFCFEYL